MSKGSEFETRTDREMTIDLEERIAKSEARISVLERKLEAYERGETPFKRPDAPQFGLQTT